ncbi:MAG: orotidine-5'-phosphate decarboxylase [Oscillospiraceae bacterium]|nr:orotidine-5'-phosphate decarboxylase [Oscillospiraceae bacterium]
MSFDVLQEKIFSLANPTVAGLDPRPEHIPPHILNRHISRLGNTLAAAAEAYYEFNCGLIDSFCDLVPAVKPQSAYYELLGWEGVKCLKKTADYAKSRGMYVIADVKRNDIGTTAQAYSEAYLVTVTIGGEANAPFGFDAATVNAYLGSDGIVPFIDICKKHGKGVFALVKTSNKSSGELQDMTVEDGRTVYLCVGELMERLSADTVGSCGYSCVGAVVGATYPRQLTELRQALSRTFFLVPGYGAQGGGASDVVGAFDKKGGGAIINSSRAIMCAWKKTGGDGSDYQETARAEVLRMRDELRAAVKVL